MQQEKHFFTIMKKNCKYFLIFSTRLKTLFLLKGNIRINNDTKKKINVDISFYFVDTNQKVYSANFFCEVEWQNNSAEFVNCEILNRKIKFNKKFFRNQFLR